MKREWQQNWKQNGYGLEIFELDRIIDILWELSLERVKSTFSILKDSCIMLGTFRSFKYWNKSMRKCWGTKRMDCNRFMLFLTCSLQITYFRK